MIKINILIDEDFWKPIQIKTKLSKYKDGKSVEVKDTPPPNPNQYENH